MTIIKIRHIGWHHDQNPATMPSMEPFSYNQWHELMQ
jgi:hypothetical protein